MSQDRTPGPGSDPLKPICFMVMPFGRKAVSTAQPGAPTELDCDRLWDLVYRPVLLELGYLPIRADLESSSVIVKDMLNRLKHAELVLADVSLANANVYYELGIRHVAQEVGCVQVAADWFKPMFDIQQFRTITFPMKEGHVPEEAGVAARAGLVAKIDAYRSARSPYHELVDATPEDAFRESAEALGSFQAELSAIRQLPRGHAREAAVKDSLRRHAQAAARLPDVATELLSLARDAGNWQGVREFIESLPDAVKSAGRIREQYLLALSELGSHEQAISGLESLVQWSGPTPERFGLIGGRYKRLYRDAREKRLGAGAPQPSLEERQYLKRAIEAYDAGMQLDLNEYYCACNLPALLRARGRNGDEARAAAVDMQVIAACRRAKNLGSRDPWLSPTLFGSAFRQAQLTVMEDIADEIEGGAVWVLDSVLDDAADWILQAPEPQRDALQEVLERLRQAAQPPSNAHG